MSNEKPGVTINWDLIISMAMYIDNLELEKKLCYAILASKNLKIIYSYRKIVPKEFINDFINTVINTNIPEYIYLLAKNGNLATKYKDKLVAALIQLNNPKFIGYASLYIDGISEEMEKILANAVNNLKDYSWVRKPNPKLHEELEEILLNSDDSIENPFAPVNNEKRMKLEENA